MPLEMILGKYIPGDLLLPDRDTNDDKIAKRAAKVSLAVDAAAASASTQPAVRKSFALRSLEWQWLYGYGSACRFQPDAPVVAVRGKNASGKSALADVLLLGLFGKETEARESKHAPASVLCTGKPHGSVAWTETVVETGGEHFRIRREFVGTSKGKLSQTAIVTLEGSGEVVESGKTSVDSWVGSFAQLQDVLLVERRDRDLLALRAADQKALMDSALRSDQFQSEMDAVDESRRAHKWLGDALLASSAALFDSCGDDPDDSELALAMEASAKGGVSVLLRAKLALAEMAKRASARDRDLERRLAEFGPAEPRIVPGEVLRERRARLEALASISRSADSELRAAEASAAASPKPPRASESIEYLEEKACKYRRAAAAKELLDRLGSPCAFNDGCWACGQREGGNVKARADAEQELTLLGVSGSTADIRKKCSGYERRLALEVSRAEAEEKHRAWADAHARALARAKRASDDVRDARIELERARLENDLFRRGGRISGRREESGLVDQLSKQIAEAKRKGAELRERAGELKALRRSANARRARASALAREGTALVEKAASLKDAHAQAARAFEERYRGAVEELAAEANAVLSGPYPGLTVRADWSNGSSFSFWIASLPAEKASGFERAAVSVAVKAAMKRLGYGTGCGWMVIDEATAGIDKDNLSALPRLLEAVAERARCSVIALTHDTVPGVVTVDIDVEDGRACVRYPACAGYRIH